MRQVRNPQLELGEIRIEDIRINLKSRDDIPALLLGLQHLYSDEETRTRLFALLEEHMLPGVDRTVGRPGMELWVARLTGAMQPGASPGGKEKVNHHFHREPCVGPPQTKRR